MRQRIVHGAVVDIATPDEIVKLIPRPRQTTRIRAPETFRVSSDDFTIKNGEIYKCPIGYQFEARRVVWSLFGANANQDPSVGSLPLGGAGKWAAYLRSGNLLEYAMPQMGSNFQVPGVQTWGDEQGPYIQNGETFGIFLATGGAGFAGAQISVYLEGILTRPGEAQDA